MSTSLRVIATSAVLCGLVSGQSPEKPPPWWNVQDEVTVSLYYSFDGPQPLQPTTAITAPWYNPNVTQWSVPANLTVLPTLAGHTGVLAMVGNGAPQTALLRLRVDNDPHLDWIKLFTFQFEAFGGASGEIKAAIEQDLANYKRTSLTVTTAPLPGGWEQVTIQAQLIPQPDDETISWSFLENALGTIGIDNLFVNSKCVKPGPDQDGDALGKVGGFAIDLTAATGGAACQGVAVTEGPAPAFQRNYWVGTRATLAGATHQLFRINQSGAAISSTPIGGTLAVAPLGISDLTVETVVLTPTVQQQFVYALVDGRTVPNGTVQLFAVDSLGVPAPQRNVTLVGFPPIGPALFGLTFDPSGALGAGTFWVSDPSGTAYEFSRTGALLDSRPIPVGCRGLGYDEVLGNFYGWSASPQPSPNGPVRVNGIEWSGYDFLPTGVEFCGDLTLPNLGGPRGGEALGFEAYRRSVQPGQSSQLRFACVVEASPTAGQTRQYLYELAGPFRFGWSQFGRCGMRGGAPFLGSTTFQVTMSGVPDALFGLCYLGFSNTNWNGLPLPLSLASIGLLESQLSISPDVSAALLPPSSPGEFRLPVPLPTTSTLGYAEVFFQWVLLDPNVPGFLAATQAGKTVLYP
jgi:hypothetical protein